MPLDVSKAVKDRLSTLGGPLQVMVTPMAPHNRKPKAGLFVLALVGAALLSGCAGLGGTDEGNRAPRADLDADKTEGWTGDEFTFDAQGSTDDDGNITSWEFDFGDGTHETVTDDDAARVKHTYLEGGEYKVTVTVVDDGTHDGLEEKSDEDSIRVAVDERYPVASQVVKAAPLNNSAGSRMAIPFDADDGADRAHVNVSVQNTLVAGSSEVRVRVLDADGDVLDEETVTLPDADAKDVEFDTMLLDDGNHTLEIVAESGAASVTGELEVYYSDDQDPIQDEVMDDDEDDA
jgi:PKD repeat protein